MKIVLIEPTWDGIAHSPGNMGALRVLRRAFPAATVTLVAGERHLQELRRIGHVEMQACERCLRFQPALDTDTLPRDLLGAWSRFSGAPRQALAEADLVFMASATATSLSVAALQGWAGKAVAMLHGNAGEVSGWRSRNPLRRALDLHASLRRFVSRGGRVILQEDRIASALGKAHGWLKPALMVMGHPLLKEESRAQGVERRRGEPVRIAFAGNATQAKGFPTYLDVVAQVKSRMPGQYEFHAFSYLHPGCRHLDQSDLATRASSGHPRSEFVQLLSSVDYIFAWHDDEYYRNATSGIVYDAINLGVPLLSRRSPQIQELQARVGPVGRAFDSPAQLVAHLCGPLEDQGEYQSFVANLDRARQAQSTEALAAQLLAGLKARDGGRK